MAVYLPDWGEILEEAFELAGLELRSGYDLRTGRRSLNLLLLDWANRGLNSWTLDQQSLPLVASTATYTLPTDTVDVVDGSVQTNTGNIASQFDLSISRKAFTVYQALPNKLIQGYPTIYFVRRLATAPTVTFWPVPDAVKPYSFSYWRLRLMQPVDSGSVDTSPDVPSRFVVALIAGLAYRLAIKRSPDPNRILMLKGDYDEALSTAQSEDRDRSGVLLVPDVGGY